MLQLGCELDLSQKTLGAERGGELGLQDLDGDLAVVLDIPREVDERHTPLAEGPLDLVAVPERGGEPHQDRISCCGLLFHGPGRRGASPKTV